MQVCEQVGSACVAVDFNPKDGHCTLSGTGLTEAGLKTFITQRPGWMWDPANGGTTDSGMHGGDGGDTPKDDGKVCYAKVGVAVASRWRAEVKPGGGRGRR